MGGWVDGWRGGWVGGRTDLEAVGAEKVELVRLLCVGRRVCGYV